MWLALARFNLAKTGGGPTGMCGYAEKYLQLHAFELRIRHVVRSAG